MAKKPFTPGIDMSGDKGASESARADYIGKDADKPSPTRIALTASFQDITDVDASKDSVIDMEDMDTLILIVDFDKKAGGADDLRLRAMYGDEDDRAKLVTQEPREDDDTGSEINYEFVEHVLGKAAQQAAGTTKKHMVVIKRFTRFVKIQFKAGGTPTTDAVAVDFRGQRREGG